MPGGQEGIDVVHALCEHGRLSELRYRAVPPWGNVYGDGMHYLRHLRRGSESIHGMHADCGHGNMLRLPRRPVPRWHVLGSDDLHSL